MNKPTGATHYSKFTDTFYKKGSKCNYVWNGKDWFVSIYKTLDGMLEI